MADNEVIALVSQNNDSTCAHEILFGVHESLAIAIANMNPHERQQLLSTISSVSLQRTRISFPCKESDRDVIHQISQGWVEGLIQLVNYHSQA